MGSHQRIFLCWGGAGEASLDVLKNHSSDCVLSGQEQNKNRKRSYHNRLGRDEVLTVQNEGMSGLLRCLGIKYIC